MSERMTADGGSRPVPDPTLLTTQQLYREVEALRERIQSTNDLSEQQIDALREILDEKFVSIDRQLQLVETQRVEQKKDTKDAVDAALTAQKEAVREQTTASERAIAKSEASTAKSIEQLADNFRTSLGGIADIVSDLKDRVIAIESIKQGGKDTTAAVYALLGVLLVVAGLVVTVVLAQG